MLFSFLLSPISNCCSQITFSRIPVNILSCQTSFCHQSFHLFSYSSEYNQLHSGHAYNFPCKVSVKHFILNTHKRTGKHTIIVYLPVLLFSSIIRFQATASISPTLQTQKAQPRNHNGIPVRHCRAPPYAAIRLRLMGHAPFSLQPVLQKPASFRQGRLYRPLTPEGC